MAFFSTSNTGKAKIVKGFPTFGLVVWHIYFSLFKIILTKAFINKYQIPIYVYRHLFLKPKLFPKVLAAAGI